MQVKICRHCIIKKHRKLLRYGKIGAESAFGPKKNHIFKGQSHEIFDPRDSPLSQKFPCRLRAVRHSGESTPRYAV
jgi:hypothetical protein